MGPYKMRGFVMATLTRAQATSKRGSYSSGSSRTEITGEESSKASSANSKYEIAEGGSVNLKKATLRSGSEPI
jgi:hypothetical protein